MSYMNKKNPQLLGSGDRMTSFKTCLSVHSCLGVQEGEGNVKHPGKQWPVVEIQMEACVFYSEEQQVQREQKTTAV